MEKLKELMAKYSSAKEAMAEADGEYRKNKNMNTWDARTEACNIYTDAYKELCEALYTIVNWLSYEDMMVFVSKEYGALEALVGALDKEK